MLGLHQYSFLMSFSHLLRSTSTDRRPSLLGQYTAFSPLHSPRMIHIFVVHLGSGGADQPPKETQKSSQLSSLDGALHLHLSLQRSVHPPSPRPDQATHTHSTCLRLPTRNHRWQRGSSLTGMHQLLCFFFRLSSFGLSSTSSSNYHRGQKLAKD